MTKINVSYQPTIKIVPVKTGLDAAVGDYQRAIRRWAKVTKRIIGRHQRRLAI